MQVNGNIHNSFGKEKGLVNRKEQRTEKRDQRTERREERISEVERGLKTPRGHGVPPPRKRMCGCFCRLY